MTLTAKTVIHRLAGFRRFLVNCQGAFALEFAFVAPILILLLVATAEFGRLLGLRNELQFVAEQAGRFALVNRPPSDPPTTAEITANNAAIITAAKQQLISVPQADVVVSIARSTSNGVRYVAITAQTTYAFLNYLGLPPVALSGSTRVPQVVIE